MSGVEQFVRHASLFSHAGRNVEKTRAADAATLVTAEDLDFKEDINIRRKVRRSI